MGRPAHLTPNSSACPLSMSGIVTTELACGAVLLVEPIPSTSSAAIYWMLPVGTAADPGDGDGHSAMLSEFIFRGAGGMTSREHSDALDRMGVHRSSQTGTRHMHLEMTLLGDRLHEAQPLVVTLVREPAFPDDAVDPVRSLCLQSLESLDDEPQHLAMIHLREQHLPPPLGRSGYGQRSVLPTTDHKAVLEGVLLPFGDYKGSNIAMMVELLAAGLIGEGFSVEAARYDNKDGGPPRGGEFMLAIDPARLGDPEGWLDHAESFFANLTALDGVRLPGDRRYANRARTPNQGVQVPKSLHDKIVALSTP